MSGPLTRQEASRLLGVPTTASDQVIKQAYRRLVREHHPDRGGDPGSFDRLQRAYERLVADDAPAAPSVARGRPSRPPAPHSSEDDRADVGSVAWDLAAPGVDVPLDRDRLAVLLARDGDGPVSRVTATSRAPGSRWNGAAAKLSPAFTAWLTIAPALDDRGATVVRADLTAGGRRARRALDRVVLDGVWTRTRRSTTTMLATTLKPSTQRRTTAVRVTDRVVPLLDALRWPLVEWTATDEGR
jgi:hypothetical protein